ncbi:MAG: hypothetical protein IKY45_01345, partial [Clostridia bacterium]|nr:hypothetical protein [Clostridia bacterium]
KKRYIVNYKMKLDFINISNVEDFFKLIEKCRGKVELVTSEGDCLNLKSKLSQCISIIKLFALKDNPDFDEFDFEIEVEFFDDLEKLETFIKKEK